MDGSDNANHTSITLDNLDHDIRDSLKWVACNNGSYELTHPQIASKGLSLKSFFINIFQYFHLNINLDNFQLKQSYSIMKLRSNTGSRLATRFRRSKELQK